jgi:linoleoyl-CoA desaturase
MQTKNISFVSENISLTKDLTRRVNEYFFTNNLKKEGNIYLFLKTIILLTTAIAHYYLLVFFPIPIWLKLILCVSFGFNIAFIGFNVMHDGAHGSYSKKKWINSLMGYSLNIMGGNKYIWKAKHNDNHHRSTNIDGIDDDIDIKPFIRIHPDDPKRWYHRYQHVYWVFLYSLTYLAWVAYQDFEKYFSGKIANFPFKKMSTREHLIFWFSKILYAFVFIVLPIMKVGLLYTLIGYLIFAIVCGFVIAVVFQLAHVMPDVIFPNPDDKNRINSEWILHQFSTTADFAPDNKIITWCIGGLNFQIEHHLFQRISHIHYPNIRKIVRDFCKDYNINYIVYPTMLSAVVAHVSFLKKMGQN